MTAYKVVVIVPTFNEVQNIEQTINVLRNLAATIQPHTLEVLVVDSGSPDGTALVVKDLCLEWLGLHLLLEPERSGLGGAYLFGMRYAIDALKADVLISFDADLSHDATRIPLMLEQIQVGYDLVVASRYKDTALSSDWVWYRQLFSKVSNRFFCWILDYPQITDWTGGFRAYRAEVFLQLEPMLQPYKTYAFQLAFLHQALLMGKQAVELPFTFVDRKQGQSKISLRDTWGFCAYTLRYLYRKHLKNEP